MPYVVHIQAGSRNRGKFSRMQSTPLSSKEKVRNWIKRNPLGNYKTEVTIRDLLKNRTVTTTKSGGSLYGLSFKLRAIKRRHK